ncbi:hypothetical protein F4677DRAFT_459515 [Hypoxylon crocopeplum]|nr:hypothetical protein F4677DRAFT_459515 [Hypoxylon crocopeplum]
MPMPENAVPGQRRRRRGRGKRKDRESYPALPLNQDILDRVGGSFDVQRMTEPYQQQINHALLALYYDRIVLRPSLSIEHLMDLEIVHGLVLKFHKIIRSMVMTAGYSSDSSVWVQVHEVRYPLHPEAIQELDVMPREDIAYRLWQLCTLEVFWDEDSRKTFAGSYMDIAWQRCRTPSDTGKIKNRVLYDAFRPLFAWHSQPIWSPKDLRDMVHYKAAIGIRNMKAMVAKLDKKTKKQAKKALSNKPGVLAHRTVELWHGGAFHSTKAASNLLGGPLNPAKVDDCVITPTRSLRAFTARHRHRRRKTI